MREQAQPQYRQKTNEHENRNVIEELEPSKTLLCRLILEDSLHPMW
jgi:hypothetical protein